MSLTRSLTTPGEAAPAPVQQELVGHRAKRIFLIHEEAHLCTTQFPNSILETVDTPSVDDMLRQRILSVHHSLREEMSS